MRISQLQLHAYGPFSDRLIDFSLNAEGLHMVYGPNEAGKSTALRALIGLLYGFGHRVQDAWFHGNRKLCVGGLFTLPDGSHLHLTRHKRRKNDLINERTGEPFDQVDLEQYLGRMGRQAFEHAFGISHYALRQGVDSVLAAGGDLGQALFAAGSGVSTLKKVIQKLEVRQNQLFAPRAQKAQINAGILELNRLRKAQRDASASHVMWKQLKMQLDELAQRESSVAAQIEALAASISLFSRYRQALKHVTTWDQAQQDLSKVRSAPELPADFARQRLETQVAFNQARRVQARAMRDRAQIDEKLSALVYDEQILASQARIQSLADESHVHTKAMADSLSLREQIDDQLQSAQKILEQLRPGMILDAVEALRLPKPELKKIRRLGADGVKIEESTMTVQRSMQSLQLNLSKLKNRYDQLQQPANIQELEAVMAEAARQGQLEHQLSQARTEADRLQAQAAVELAALAIGSQGLVELEQAPVPSEETMRRFETELAAVDQELNDFQNEHARVESQLMEAERKLAELARISNLPSITDLQSHRRLRDSGWRSVRAVWLQGREADTGFMEAFAGCNDLADAYEKSVAQADRTADSLLEEAGVIAQADSFRNECRQCRSHLPVLQARRDALKAKRRSLWDEWTGLWANCRVSPLAPREMMQWARRAVELKGKAADLRKRESEIKRLRKNLDRVKDAMSGALLRCGVKVPQNIAFATLIELAGNTLKSAHQVIEERRSLESGMAALQEEIESTRQRQREVEQHQRNWSAQWSRAVEPLGFGAQASANDVHDFLSALEEVFACLDKSADIRRRVMSIAQDYEAYNKRVADAVAELAPDLAADSAQTAVMKLNARLIEQTDQHKLHDLLESEKRKKQAELSRIKEKASLLNEKLNAMCAQAGCTDMEQLPGIEKQAAAKSKLLDDLEKIGERLGELAGGQDVADFIAHVRTHNPDELAARLERLTSEHQRLHETQKELVAAIALARKDLESIGGRSRAAAIAQTAEGLAGQLASDVANYIRLKLASAVLIKAVERYRLHNQSPVLEFASDLFATITRQAFSGMRADYDEQGEPVLMAIRPDGTRLRIGNLSDGSRDQLFLALRLGALNHYVRKNGPMPFVVDDVLVHFDDDRSGAALAAMSDLARITQIIFFTHHRHLLDLARSSVPESVLQVHRLQA